MNNKSKVFVVFCVLLASVVLLTCTCFAEVSSAFTETSDGYVVEGSTSQTILVSACPDDFDIKNTTYTASYTVKLSNDFESDYTFTIVGHRSGSSNAYWPSYRVNGAITPGWQSINSTGVTVILSAGDYLEVQLPYNAGDRGWVDVSVSPDPQYIPSPFDGILASVSAFITSFFVQASDIVTLIMSSWVFLVPITMMLVVFFVMAIRKIVKGV